MSISDHSKPLITFTVVAYNQEAYIRQAVESALAQTYTPLEIIISDDCSHDNTYAICQEVVSTYCGPHTVRLNRNATNMGLARHVNKVFSMARGELLVGNAGDDISQPNRTAVLVGKWLEWGRPMGIGSSATIIDRNGKALGVRKTDLACGTTGFLAVSRKQFVERYLAGKSYWLLGATAAWSIDCWRLCGPLEADCVAEDAAFSFRAGLHSGLCAIDEPLVFYRTHDANITFGVREQRPVTLAACKKRLYHAQSKAKWSTRNLVSDARVVEIGARDGWLEEETAVALMGAIQERAWRLEKACAWWDLSPIEKLISLNRPLYKEWYRNIASLLGLHNTAVLMALGNRLRAVVGWAK
jgi:hypothetical protein